jgi:hypothetical protein
MRSFTTSGRSTCRKWPASGTISARVVRRGVRAGRRGSGAVRNGGRRALGIAAIHERGGFVIAQDEAAEFGGMPAEFSRSVSAHVADVSALAALPG